MTIHKHIFRALLAGLVVSMPALTLASVRVESQTLIRYFERDSLSSSDNTVIPVYEYLGVDAGTLDDAGVSIHGYGWGRIDAGDDKYFTDTSEGELLYGYIQYVAPESTIEAKVGRFQLFSGVTSEMVDGASLTVRPLDGLSLSAYSGLPSAYTESDGASGDMITGGRLGVDWGSSYSLGVSHKYLRDNNRTVESLVGLDFALVMPLQISLRGISAYNMHANEWSEQYLAASVWLGDWLLEPSFQRLDYQGFFNDSETSGSPFRLLDDTEELLTVFGAVLSKATEENLEVKVSARQYVHDESGEDASYASLAVTTKMLSFMLGAEGGFMFGDSAMNNYQLGRIYFYSDRGIWFASGDAMYVRYDEEILGEKDSIFLSLGGGFGPVKGFSLKLSADYSADPYFKEDLRGSLTATYVFDSAQ